MNKRYYTAKSYNLPRTGSVELSQYPQGEIWVMRQKMDDIHKLILSFLKTKPKIQTVGRGTVSAEAI